MDPAAESGKIDSSSEAVREVRVEKTCKFREQSRLSVSIDRSVVYKFKGTVETVEIDHRDTIGSPWTGSEA